MARRSIALVTALVMGFAGLLVGGETASAAAPAKVHGKPVHAKGFKYSFGNWDYDPNAKVFDNPVSIIFVSNRPDMVDRVYDQIDGVGLDSGGGKMRNSGTGPSRKGVGNTRWTSYSAGRKGAFGCWGKCGKKTDIHLRTYGPDGRQGTQVYQGSSGLGRYYLVATIHFDADEHGKHPTFGYQDTARRLLVQKMTARGQWKFVTAVPVGNKCNSTRNVTQHGKQLCRHDGTAWVVDIDR